MRSDNRFPSGADSGDLSELVRSAEPDLLLAVLRNPLLGERHLLELLKRRNLPAEILKAVARLPLSASSRRVKIALAGHPAAPAALFSTILSQLRLFELVALLQLPGTLPDQKAAAERAILRLLPETPLGNKIALARRGSSAIVEALIREPDPRLVDAVLASPALKEAGIVSFLNSPAAGAETISAIARHPRWGKSPHLRQVILRNKKTPAIWFTLFLPALPTRELERLQREVPLGERQRKELELELVKRSAATSEGGTTS